MHWDDLLAGHPRAQQRQQQQRPAAAAPEPMAGNAWAYRLGSCCGHARIKHLTTYPMPCTAVERRGDTRPNGSVVATTDLCPCEGWQEKTG